MLEQVLVESITSGMLDVNAMGRYFAGLGGLPFLGTGHTIVCFHTDTVDTSMLILHTGAFGE